MNPLKMKMWFTLAKKNSIHVNHLEKREGAEWEVKMAVTRTQAWLRQPGIAFSNPSIFLPMLQKNPTHLVRCLG